MREIDVSRWRTGIRKVGIDITPHEEFYQTLNQRELELLYARDKHFRGSWEALRQDIQRNHYSHISRGEQDGDVGLIDRLQGYENHHNVVLVHNRLHRLCKPLEAPKEINNVVNYDTLDQLLGVYVHSTKWSPREQDSITVDPGCATKDTSTRNVLCTYLGVDNSELKDNLLSRLGIRPYQLIVRYDAKPRPNTWRKTGELGVEAFPFEADSFFLIPLLFKYADIFPLNGRVEPFEGKNVAYWLSSTQCEILLWEYLKKTQREKVQVLWDCITEDYLLSLEYDKMSFDERQRSGLYSIGRSSDKSDERKRRFEELRDAPLDDLRFNDIRLFDRHGERLYLRFHNLARKIRQNLVGLGLIYEEGFDQGYDHRYVRLSDKVMITER